MIGGRESTLPPAPPPTTPLLAPADFAADKSYVNCMNLADPQQPQQQQQRSSRQVSAANFKAARSQMEWSKMVQTASKTFENIQRTSDSRYIMEHPAYQPMPSPAPMSIAASADNRYLSSSSSSENPNVMRAKQPTADSHKDYLELKDKFQQLQEELNQVRIAALIFIQIDFALFLHCSTENRRRSRREYSTRRSPTYSRRTRR